MRHIKYICIVLLQFQTVFAQNNLIPNNSFQDAQPGRAPACNLTGVRTTWANNFDDDIVSWSVARNNAPTKSNTGVPIWMDLNDASCVSTYVQSMCSSLSHGLFTNTSSRFIVLDASQSIQKICKNAIYIEGGGNGVTNSLNYERNLLYSNYFITNLRLGLGMDFFTVKNLIVPLLPIEINSFSNMNYNHHLECGIGVTPYYSPIEESPAFPINENLNVSNLKSKINALLVVRIGYRYQKKTRGWIIRVAYTPIVYDTSFNGNSFCNHLGFSIGRNF